MARIIIDGLDGSGKSTHCKNLSNELNITPEHETFKTNYNVDDYIKKIERSDYILDRSFLSEWVYSGIYGRKCKLQLSDMKKIVEACVSNNVKIIIRLRPIDQILKVLIERGEVLDQDLIKARQNWDDLIQWLHTVIDIEVYEDVTDQPTWKEYNDNN